MSHSTVPSCWSGSKPVSASIQSGQKTGSTARTPQKASGRIKATRGMGGSSPASLAPALASRPRASMVVTVATRRYRREACRAVQSCGACRPRPRGRNSGAWVWSRHFSFPVAEPDGPIDFRLFPGPNDGWIGRVRPIEARLSEARLGVSGETPQSQGQRSRPSSSPKWRVPESTV
jgi:hypothetical protein